MLPIACGPTQVSNFSPLYIVTMVILNDIVKQPVLRDFCFELFAHVTKFFGYKVEIVIATRISLDFAGGTTGPI